MKIPVESALCLCARSFCHSGMKAVLPASCDLCHVARICHPKRCLKAHMVTMMGNAKDKSCLQISEKSHKEEAGYSCLANEVFGKHSEEEQIIKNVLHLLAFVRQGKQPQSCDQHRLVWHGTHAPLCLSLSVFVVLFGPKLSCLSTYLI